MIIRREAGRIGTALASAVLLVAAVVQADAASAAGSSDVWAHSNFVATTVNHFDAKERGPDERAKMLKRVGITKFAYNWREPDVPKFDEEIEALKKNGVELYAWILYGSENPHTQTILDAFKRHNVHPVFWVYPQGGDASEIKLPPDKQEERLKAEVAKLEALSKKATPYGVKLVLYNHNGWWGSVENQLAMIERLKQRGVRDVGMVYNFTHARDKHHDDSKEFATLWPKMKPYVVQVNITGMNMDDVKNVKYPSEGDGEIEMMRIIQQSGWHGAIGIPAEKGGAGVNDAEVTLRNYIIGIDWIAKELNKPGSGGPKPLSSTP